MLLMLALGSDQEDFEKCLLCYLEGSMWGVLFLLIKKKGTISHAYLLVLYLALGFVCLF